MLESNISEDILKHHRRFEAKKYNREKGLYIGKVLIVGAGSIGALIGSALIKAGLNVTFAGRSHSNYTERIKCSGLTITYPCGEVFSISPSLPNVRFVDTQQKLKEKFDLIVVAVKSNCLASVKSYINDHATKDTILFHAQNGIPYWWFNEYRYLSSLSPTLVEQVIYRPYLNSIDPEGMILRTLGDRCLVGCVMKAPCSKTAAGHVEVRKPPKMILGLTNTDKYSYQEQKIRQLCEIFSTYGLETSYSSNIRVEVCNKLAINATTNILSALTGSLISKLTSNVDTNNLITTILQEINQVFQVYGINEADLPTERKLYSYINQPGSQKHLPSLAQDFYHHRQGEVNLITAPVEMAKIAGIEVPTLSSLAELLKLGQKHTLNSQDGKFAILDFKNGRGFHILKEEIERTKTIICKETHISDIVAHVMQINQSAKIPTLVYS